MLMNPGFRRLTIMVLSTLATVSTFSICAPSAVAQTGCISGLVIDETGRPREHIKVEAQKTGMSWTHHQAWTDANGEFQILGVPPAKYGMVSGEAEGPYPNYANSFFYGTAELFLSVAASLECEHVVVHLGPATARLNLSVLDNVTKQPIQPIMVQLRRPNLGGLDKTLSSAEVTVPSMTKLQMQLQAVGYEKSAPIELPPFQPGEVRYLNVELQPAMKGCIAGSVTEENNVPVVGAQVRPIITNRGNYNEDHSVLTDAKGRFQVNDLEAGPYRVYAAKPSDAYLGTQNGIDVNLSSSWPCLEVSLKIGLKAARLRLVVVDAGTQKEIPQISTGFTVLGAQDYLSMVERLPGGKFALVQPLHKLGVEIHADGYEAGKVVYVGPLAPDEQKDILVQLQRIM